MALTLHPPPVMTRTRRRGVVVIRTPAKVNLFLEVVGRRPDGYHDIASLMVAVSLYDTLTLRDDPSGALTLTCSRPDLSTGPDNLIVRAAELLRKTTGCQRGAAIQLEKRIPLAAGLAGGSSDAAATLTGLNRLWRLGLSRAHLVVLGAVIGSDVAFFFHRPGAWCTGRGEIVESVKLGRPLDLVLVCPPFGLSTAEVYRGVTTPAELRSGEDVLNAAREGDIAVLGRGLFNRLQEPAVRLRPELGEYLAWLAALRPAGRLMSGSGSTLFALCADPGEALRVARGLAATIPEQTPTPVRIVRSCP
jgi:4-diphosphocytidyl-2-C-methyl-D-erythritol kinase